MNQFVRIDDGTMDTVLQCDTCGIEERYDFDGCEKHMETTQEGGCECYKQFVAAAIDDRNNLHECPGPGAA